MQSGNIIVQTSQPNIYVQTQASPYTPPYVANSDQIVITSQPGVYYKEWSNGLFDCMDDCLDCLYAHYCRLCYAIELGGMHQEHCCTIFCCGSLALMPLRTKIRTERNIKGTICEDIMVISCCEPCALIQMKKETRQNPVQLAFATK